MIAKRQQLETFFLSQNQAINDQNLVFKKIKIDTLYQFKVDWLFAQIYM